MSLSLSTDRPLALCLPLHGSRLIEASAGTGKTFTISALYLRLILGHGGADGFARELLPPEILVVTFTDAATRELRDRIRARLVQAARAFRNEVRPDALLEQLRADFPPDRWPACARRLDIAAQWMDEAAVSTIHGWCQRMLREHAFDSGSLFTQTLETDHGELLASVVRDYWRQQCYPLTGAALDWVIRHWSHPDTLLSEQVRPLLGETDPAPTETLGSVLQQQLERRSAALAALKQPWPAWADELEALLNDARNRKAFNGSKLKQPDYQRWFTHLRTWAADPAQQSLDLKTGFTRLTPTGLAEAWKGEPPVHPALEAMVTLPASLRNLPDCAALAQRHAAAWVGHRFAQEKRRRAEMGFDDMLNRLDQALQGVNGERLAGVIRQQFPVALIDEFQDTDPVQYRIFDSIYRVAENRADCGVLLIGDPKQAIYAFRGADIHTYLHARRATAGRLADLDTNFRSSHALVNAVNRVFELAEQRTAGDGAFLFRTAQDNPLPFHAVKARGRAEYWQVEEQVPPALTFWHLETAEPLAGGDYRHTMAAHTATEIARLLSLAQQQRAGFRDGERLEPLRPNDIAVLVRNLREAEEIRRQLAARGIRSVYLSDQDSVFASPEARDLLLWLRACAEPENDRTLRAALASRTLRLGLGELERLNQDERVWERRVLQFRGYRQCWQRQGVLPMLRQLLHDFALPQQLLAEAEGERVLTNLLHLAELLQRAAAQLDGEQALIRYLSELLAGEIQAADEQILRLESDAELVRVVTIHKSKGLEYPLVFLPFACAFRPVDGSQPVSVHDGQRRRLVLAPDAEALAQADRERLGEELRLLYVALTRARHACWLGIADRRIGNAKASQLHRSALGYLLGGGQALSSDVTLKDWLAPLHELPHSQVVAPPAVTLQRLGDMPMKAVEPQWRTPCRPATEHWWIASYSALRFSSNDTAPAVPAPVRFDDAAPDRPAAQKALDDERERATWPLHPDDVPTLHRFPRGPNPGTFLHGLLEMAGREGFANLAAQPERLREQIARRCQLRGLTAWIEPLYAWLDTLLRRPLDVGTATPVVLSGLRGYQPELEFWLEVRRTDVQRLDTLVKQHILPGLARPALESDTLNGLFKGFIDLVFEHEGRYYVLDYKSNWLGEHDAAYTDAAMTAAVAHRRYDLQYVLYVLALHRQLRLRLPGYAYDRHVGGALYLFLRGSHAPTQGLHHARPPRELIEALDRLFQETEA